MTQTGINRAKYSNEVEPRPFSRFTSVSSEVKANDEWKRKADSYYKISQPNYYI
jgi:hypothetical protein